MADQTLVIVESPAKAKTINKYLGRDFTVLASFGHVRDLPAKDGSVRPEEDFAMDWELADRGKSRMDEIARAAKDASRVLLATDPDREGEAISWHVQQLLRERRGLKDLDIRRVTFNEITKSAILDAVAHPRDLDRELIEAYLARRALDYLVGFTLSPVLWRKLPGSRSAGRVQSVALRLICERELEIERFRPREFWSIEAVFRTPKGEEFTARLTHLNGRKLDKFDLPDEASARAAVATIDPLAFAVVSVETKQVRRHPAPPFTTSTLQQEASRKLGMSATQTMRTAQRLYEGVDLGGETVGLITYMRTDGLTLAGEAIAQARQAIGSLYGPTYVPGQPRVYKSTAKNAQEAHEAIRPTDLRRRPEEVARFLSREELRLYELVWKRTMACQMESAVLDQAIVDVADARQTAVFRAVGTVVRFDGFLKVYQEDRDDPSGEEDESQRRLPAMAKGDAVDRRKTVPEQHFTQPPPRYTEASLVKRMEELGIGRPSTYASILQVLQDREYVRLEKKRFIPEDRGRIVTAFLENFFRRYVEYDFTAKLEEQLDDISGGRLDWKQVLRDFWAAFHAAVEETKDLKIGDVISALDEALSDHLFPPKGDGTDPRLCPSCAKGRLGLKLGRTGAFVGCSNYPECRYTRPLGAPAEENGGEESALPRHLGEDPETGLPVSIRKGPYGIYAQLGPPQSGPGDEAEKGAKPKRASLTKAQDPMAMTLEEALALLSLPREIGRHPESGEPIVAGIGRFGPYLKHGERYKNLPPDEDVLKIGMNRAVDLLAADNGRAARASAEPLREVGPHPADGEPIKVFAGRYGPYVRHGKVMASLPRGVEPEAVTVDKAVEWLAAKAAKGPAKGGRGRAAPKSSAKKTPAKKATARKGKAAE
ncbi:type I DNA topoisomerase [Inquilinus limosus]|uniref:type I DNA topoisomerase n=1 Tax=Inquilinus limosus TaxID=171674 RepID=UPI00055289B0|nr:type I DNA topoisomerase [Inquilinus limosus]